MRIFKFLAVAGLAPLAISQPASATPLNLPTIAGPDIVSVGISVNYDAVTDQLTATGTAMSISTTNADGVAEFIMGGSFTLTATVDATGTASAGTLTIGGTLMSYDSTLLEGSLNPVGGFGFDEDGLKPDYFDFRFTTSGGSLSGDGTYPSQFGVILTLFSEASLPDNPATGTIFDSSFSGGAFQSVSDVLPVPEPNTALLMGLGLTFLTLSRGRNEDVRSR